MKRTPIHESFGAGRRARERARREEDVLEAAERVIGRNGFHGAGMTEIAREAEYAIGTLYNLFASKEALYERLLVSRAEELSGLQRAALGGPGRPRARLEAALAAKLAFFRRHLDFMRIYSTTSTGPGDARLPAKLLKLREGNARAIAAVIDEAARAGDLRAEVRPEDAALAFQAITQAFLFQAAKDRAGFDEERVRAAVKAVFFDPLFGPEATPGRMPRRTALAGARRRR
jgi:AcrR family transcriptional regulator